MFRAGRAATLTSSQSQRSPIALDLRVLAPSGMHSPRTAQDSTDRISTFEKLPLI